MLKYHTLKKSPYENKNWTAVGINDTEIPKIPFSKPIFEETETFFNNEEFKKIMQNMIQSVTNSTRSFSDSDIYEETTGKRKRKKLFNLFQHIFHLWQKMVNPPINL